MQHITGDMERPLRSELATHWALDPSTVFLNHGSFGATPNVIREEQRHWQDRMEHEPVAFLDGEGLEQMAVARHALAQMLSCNPDDLALIENATSGVNTVMRSLTFSEGDEILVPDHAYQACRNTIDFVAQRWKAKVVTVPLPFPIEGPHVVMDAMLNAVTERTVLAMIDTVTSPTGLRMPFEDLTSQLEARGVSVLLDAATASAWFRWTLTSSVPLTPPATATNGFAPPRGQPSFTCAKTSKWTSIP